MKVEVKEFLAASIAEIDWQMPGHNENPYNPVTQTEAHKAYNKRFEQLYFNNRELMQ